MSTKDGTASAVRKAFYDAVSGERVEMFEGQDSRKKSCPYRAFAFSSEAGNRYLSLLKLNGSQYRLWNYLVSQIDWNNAVNYKPVQASKDLEIDLPAIGRLLKGLIETGICWRVSEPGARNNYIRLHPFLLWKGDKEAVPYVLSTAPILTVEGSYWDKHYRKQCGFADRPDGWLLDE